jgi:predicted helicase
MTNARCLTEGVDLPAIDCVCFTDPKRSKVDIVQAAGRAFDYQKVKNLVIF